MSEYEPKVKPSYHANLLSKNERDYYESICPKMRGAVIAGSIHSMANFMQRYYGKDVIIQICADV